MWRCAEAELKRGGRAAPADQVLAGSLEGALYEASSTSDGNYGDC